MCTSETQAAFLEERRATTHAGHIFGLIYDALKANFDGLRSHEIFHWLREHRPEAFEEEKFRIYTQLKLSAVEQKRAIVLEVQRRGSDGSG